MAVTPKAPAESADSEAIDLSDSPAPPSKESPTQQEEVSATVIGTPGPDRSTGLLLKAIQDHRRAAGSVLKAD